MNPNYTIKIIRDQIRKKNRALQIYISTLQKKKKQLSLILLNQKITILEGI